MSPVDTVPIKLKIRNAPIWAYFPREANMPVISPLTANAIPIFPGTEPRLKVNATAIPLIAPLTIPPYLAQDKIRSTAKILPKEIPPISRLFKPKSNMPAIIRRQASSSAE